MTIDEAIKLLRKDIDEPGSVAIEDLGRAEELGIEALKRLQEHRSSHIDISYCPLPSETEE